jgi:Cu/Ag efflux pump CusA
MRWIIQTSLRYRYVVVFLAVVLMVVGISRIRNSAVDVFPEFAPPKVEVQTLSTGLSASAVEELVTVPIEQALYGVPGLDVMRSRSVPDLSDIVLIFKRASTGGIPYTADLGCAAGHDPTAFLDQPGDEDRHFVGSI